MSAALGLGEVEPDKLRDAMLSPQALHWTQAVKTEFDSLVENGTWNLVVLPPHRLLIKSRWTLKIKPGLKERGKINKVCFVAKGFSQQPGVDYIESKIYAPTVKAESLRILLSIAAAQDLELWQFDVKTAFVHEDLDPDVELYVEQPEGCITPGQKHLVLRLLKPLYGLKQAPRKWNEKFNSFFILFGLVQLTIDPCIFRFVNDPTDVILLGLLVDDGTILSKHKERALAIVSYLEDHFQMTSGPLDCYIGLNIIRNRPERSTYVVQTPYINKLIEKFWMSDCHPVDLPADPDSRLSWTGSPSQTRQSNVSAYKALVGGLMYVTTLTRSEIVIALSRFAANPGQPHWKAAKRVLAYLKGTADYGLRYSGGVSPNLLTAYSDSDFAGDIDTRRSTTGSLFLLNGGPMSWKSHLQKPTAQSTAETEYQAAGYCSRSNVYLREDLLQVGHNQIAPTPLHCDNNSAIRMVEVNNLMMVPVSSTDQLADIITKPLEGHAFKINRNRIGVVEVPAGLRV